MEKIIGNPYIEAGVRVIYRRTLACVGCYFDGNIPTSVLIRMVKGKCEAELKEQVDRWAMMAEGKPGISALTADLMIRQARTALEVLRFPTWRDNVV